MAALEIIPSRKMRLRITVLVSSAILLACTEVYLLAGGGADFFARRTTLTTYMADAAGLTADSEVRLNGLHIGDVQDVDLSGSLEPQRIVRVQMRVLTRYLKYIPSDSLTDVNADTIASDKFIEIAEGKSALPIGENAVIQSQPMPLATDRADVLQAVQDRLTQIDQILSDMSSPQTQIGRFFLEDTEYKAVLAGITDFDNALHDFLNPRSQLGQAIFSPVLYEQIRDFLARIEGVLVPIQNGEGLAGNLFASDRAYNEFVRNIADYHAMLADANSGKGQFGALLQDDAVYTQMTRLLESANAMLASLNAGEGTAGRLLTSAQLYESLNGQMRHMAATLRDLRAHPQKYLRVRHKIF